MPTQVPKPISADLWSAGVFECLGFIPSADECIIRLGHVGVIVNKQQTKQENVKERDMLPTIINQR